MPWRGGTPEAIPWGAALAVALVGNCSGPARAPGARGDGAGGTRGDLPEERAALAVAAGDAPAPASIVAGVVADPDGHTIYVMAPDGVAAIEVATGRERWRTAAAVKPMAIAGDRLIAIGAQTAHHGIAVLDARTGQVAATCAGGAAGPIIEVFDGLGSSVSSAGWIVDGEPVITWTRHTFYAGGVEPTPEEEEAARSTTSGALAVNPATGCARATEPPAPGPNVAVHAPSTTTGPLRVGDVTATLETRADAGTTTLLLHRTRGGHRLPDVTVGAAPSGHLHAVLSHDRRAVLAAQQRTLPDRRRDYDWRIVALDSGALLELPGRGYAPSGFAVLGDVIVAAAGVVEGVTRDGRSLWRVGLRITDYRGPYPP